jgi:hypothetical protein
MQHARAFWTFAALTAAAISASACGAQAVEDIPRGTEVIVRLENGNLVRGRLMDVRPETLVVERESSGRPSTIDRAVVADVEQPGASRSLTERLFSREPQFDDVVIPAGTIIPVRLETALASNSSGREDVVRAELQDPVLVDGRGVLPAGAAFVGNVTSAVPSGKVKGRAHLAFAFDRLATGSTTYDVVAKPFAFTAPGTKRDDALKIGVGAGAGSVIGALAGGKKGAAVAAAVGGGAGTAVVLATEGEEVRMSSGTRLRVELTQPLTVRVPRAIS